MELLLNGAASLRGDKRPLETVRLRHMVNVSVPLSWAAGTAEMAAFIRSILHRNPVKVL